MIRAYDEIVNFIAAGTTSSAIAKFEASAETQTRVADLISREKAGDLSSEESSELDHFLKIEHLLRLVKAKARLLGSAANP